MSWKLTHKITWNYPVEPTAILAHKGIWVFRSFDWIYAYRIEDLTLLWTINQHCGSPFHLINVNEIVVTILVEKENAIEVAGIDIETGKILWKQQVSLSLFSGKATILNSLGNTVFLLGLSEKVDKGYLLVKLDAITGKILSETPVVYNYGTYVSGKLAFFPSSEGLLVMSENGSDFQTVLPDNIEGISSNGKCLYLLNSLNTGAFEIKCVDASTYEDIGSYNNLEGLGYIQKMIPLQKEGHVLLWGSDKTQMVDMLNNQRLNQLDIPENIYSTDAIYTPHGIIVKYKNAEGKRILAVHNEITGLKIDELPSKPGLGAKMFYDSGVFLTVGINMHFFTWQESVSDIPEVKIAYCGINDPEEAPLEQVEVKQEESELTEKQKDLLNLIDKFIACMREKDDEVYKKLAREFNREFSLFLNYNEEESVGTFAKRISNLGIPYETAFSDLVIVRGVGEASY